jgi:hypothetical protein
MDNLLGEIQNTIANTISLAQDTFKDVTQNISTGQLVAVGATALGAGALGLGVATAVKAKRKKKVSKKKSKKKTTKRKGRKLKFGSKAYRRKYLGRGRRKKRSGRSKQKQPHTAGKRKDTSHKRIRYTKHNQPYIILANGRARFIKKSSVARARKLKGGRY